MNQSKFYIPTSKQVSSQAVAVSHILALRAGYIHQNAAGIYTYLPMMNMIIENINKIIDEELQKIDANKITMPLLEPAELWEKSGRWNDYGSELFRVKDRHDRSYALAPTHEELITDLVKNQLNSYKKYPLNLYQIGTKMRDETRPRFGLLRGREFLMMDGYSFSKDEKCLDEIYNKYYSAYEKIFNRCNLSFKTVIADNGSMGGSKSHEFMALASIGEDTICYEDDKDEALNIEIAKVLFLKTKNEGTIKDIQKIETKKITKIEDLEKNLNYDNLNIIKSVCFEDENQKLVICFIAGKFEINLVKLEKIANVNNLVIAKSETLKKYGLCEGYIGPLNLDLDAEIYFDNSIYSIVDGVCGANEYNYHLTGINFERDFNDITLNDIRNIIEGEKTDEKSNGVKFAQGIEIGHIFALGDRYTKALEMTFLDENQKQQTPLMGCYGIGVSRLVSAIIEQNHDEMGIILPESISPFDIHLIVLDYEKNQLQRSYAHDIESELIKLGYSVLVDDRNERPGIKFKDADLIGLPKQIIIGKKFEDDLVEFKVRRTNEKIEMKTDELFKMLIKK